jgi:hypothetical protein
LVISFSEQLLNDPRVEDVDVPIKKFEKNETRKDKIHNLLRYQSINRSHSSPYWTSHIFSYSLKEVRCCFNARANTATDKTKS